MNWAQKLLLVDRRIIFLLVFLGALIPILFPIGLGARVSPPVKSVFDKIEGLKPGDAIMLSFDYGPSDGPELDPMANAILRHCHKKGVRVLGLSLFPLGGVDMAIARFAQVSSEVGAQYGIDYVNLGYKDGREAVMVLMGQGVANAFPRDYRGLPTREMPIMRRVRNYSSFPLLISISAGYPGTKEWVQQVQARFHLPMVSGCTAVSAPEYYPYLQSGQLLGLLGGMAGAAEYEKARGETGAASRGMDAQSLAHVFVAVMILLGNLVQWTRRRRSP